MSTKSKFNEAALIKLAREIKPVVKNKKGKLHFIEPVDISEVSFMYDPRYSEPAKGLKEIGRVTTEHTTGGFFFKPSVKEVLTQIPNYILNENPVAFSILEGSASISDDRSTSHATTVFYAGKLPEKIKKQPVILAGHKK